MIKLFLFENEVTELLRCANDCTNELPSESKEQVRLYFYMTRDGDGVKTASADDQHISLVKRNNIHYAI